MWNIAAESIGRESLTRGAEATATAAAMPFPAWLAEVRRLLTNHPQPDVDEGGWSDDNVRRYYDEGLSPASAATELQFRELARS